ELHAGVAGGELGVGRVELHVGVVDLAGVEVVGHGGEREGVARALVGPRVVAVDDDVRVAGLLVVLVQRALGRLLFGDLDLGVASAGAVGVHPGREGLGEDLPGLLEGDPLGGVLLEREADAGVGPEELDAAVALHDGGAAGAGTLVAAARGA